jgi:WhiB family redox-sensing transcriptional regulator
VTGSIQLFKFMWDDTPQPWRKQAACRGLDPELFFPKRGASNDVAVAVCASCPVRDECLEYALNHTYEHGIWGGASERERRRILRARRRVA